MEFEANFGIRRFLFCIHEEKICCILNTDERHVTKEETTAFFYFLKSMLNYIQTKKSGLRFKRLRLLIAFAL